MPDFQSLTSLNVKHAVVKSVTGTVSMRPHARCGIGVTESHYLDKKSRVTSGLGAALVTKIIPMELLKFRGFTPY
jgi:hypothetical protein